MQLIYKLGWASAELRHLCDLFHCASGVSHISI